MPATEPDFRHATIRVPEHVVSRDLGQQTVVLNLRTGRYHGLNATGGAMLASLREHGSIDGAASQVAGLFEASREEVRDDLIALCRELHERGLIELDARG